MFGLFKQKKITSLPGYYPIATDMHSHILPGIDDGSPDVETSVMLISNMMDLGIMKATATPHIIGDIYRNDAASIHAALDKLKAVLPEKAPGFEISVAAEYMLDSYFFDLLQHKVPLLAVKDNIVLTEFSYSSMPSNPEQMAFTILTEGYVPILAHPERYGYYHQNYDIYHHLKDLGFLLQVNLLSLTGYYGKEVARAARYLIKNDLISFAGTDLHHDRHSAALSDPKNRQLFAELFQGVELQNEHL